MGSPAQNDTLDTKISRILDEVVVEKDGKKTLDWGQLKSEDNISEELKFAVIAEKRRRDTQASYTKINQQYQLTKAEAERLKEELPKTLATLPENKLRELEDLKYENPDEWYEKLKEYEEEAKLNATKKLNEIVTQAQTQATQNYIAQTREEKLAEFNRLNPDRPLTDENLAYDIPVRVKDQLEKGDITFEEALKKIHKIVYGGATVNNPDTLKQPNIGSVGTNSGGVAKTGNKKEEIFF